MKVITSHNNADFDSFSMVAAKKDLPRRLLVFPGSQEKTSGFPYSFHSYMYTI